MTRSKMVSVLLGVGVSLAMTTSVGAASAKQSSANGEGARLDRKVLQSLVRDYRRNVSSRPRPVGITRDVEIPGAKEGARPFTITVRREAFQVPPTERRQQVYGRSRFVSKVEWTIQGKKTESGIAFLNARERRQVLRALKGLLPEGEVLRIERPDFVGFRAAVTEARKAQHEAERLAKMTPLERTIRQMGRVPLTAWEPMPTPLVGERTQLSR